MLRIELLVSNWISLAQRLHLLQEDNWRVGLGEENESDDGTSSREYHHGPEYPLPGCTALDDESGYKWTEYWAEEYTGREQTCCWTTTDSWPNVGNETWKIC